MFDELRALRSAKYVARVVYALCCPRVELVMFIARIAYSTGVCLHYIAFVVFGALLFLKCILLVKVR